MNSLTDWVVALSIAFSIIAIGLNIWAAILRRKTRNIYEEIERRNRQAGWR